MHMDLSGQVSSGTIHRKMSVGDFLMVRFASIFGVASVTLYLVSGLLDINIIIGYSYWTCKWNTLRSLSSPIFESGSLVICLMHSGTSRNFRGAWGDLMW